jgi:hypothetical protein
MVEHLAKDSLDYWIAALEPYSAIAEYVFLNNLDVYAERHGYLIEPADDEIYPYKDAHHPGTREWIEYSQLWVARIIGLLRERHINVMIAVYPHPEHLQMPRLRYSFRLYEDFAKKQGVLFHDATPAFLRQPDVQMLFFSDDIHYNYRGQKVWADDLSEFVIAHVDELLGWPAEHSR